MGKKKNYKFTYLLGAPVGLADIVAILQVLEDLGNSGLLLAQLLHLQRLSTALRLLRQAFQSLLNELNILDTELLADDVQVTRGVDVTLDVDNFSIIEATHNLEDGIDGTNVGQESVTETSTGRGTTCQTGDIIDRQVGRNLRLGLVVLAQPIETIIGDDDTRLFGVNGGIGKVGRVTQVGLGDGLEERRFTDVGQTNLWYVNVEHICFP